MLSRQDKTGVSGVSGGSESLLTVSREGTVNTSVCFILLGIKVDVALIVQVNNLAGSEGSGRDKHTFIPLTIMTSTPTWIVSA